MAIAKPVTKTIISTTAWGVPITDAVNANTAAIAANAPTAWTPLTLINGWVSANGAYKQTSYRKAGDLLHLQGALSGGTNGSVFANLPVGFRPAFRQEYVQFMYSAGLYIHCQLVVVPNGDMTLTAATISGAAIGACNINQIVYLT